MKALMCHQWGSPDQLTLEDVPSPALKADEIRIKVHAVGVNYADVVMILGQYQVKPPLTFTPGMELAGEVIETGAQMDKFAVGDRVLALVDYGAYAEEVIASKNHLILKIPDSMDYATAAAFSITYGTSHLAMTHRAQLQSDETLLVLGASGGVGLTAIEIAKLIGANVIAAASTHEKLDIAKNAGADHGINYNAEDLRERVKVLTNGKGVDVVYDPVGGDKFDAALRAINWEGRMIIIGFTSGVVPQIPANIALVKNISIIGFYWGSYITKRRDVLVNSLQTLIGWHSEGKLKPHISARFPLEQTPAALLSLAQRKSTGKIVVEIQ